jgi:hypothetical protein
MGARNSTNTRPRSFSSSDDGASGALGLSAGMAMAGYLGGPSSSNGAARARASSIPGFGPGRHGHGISIPTSNGGAHGAGSPDSDSSPDEVPLAFRGFMQQASSLPPLGGLLIHGEYQRVNVNAPLQLLNWNLCPSQKVCFVSALSTSAMRMRPSCLLSLPAS